MERKLINRKTLLGIYRLPSGRMATIIAGVYDLGKEASSRAIGYYYNALSSAITETKKHHLMKMWYGVMKLRIKAVIRVNDKADPSQVQGEAAHMEEFTEFLLKL
jgi:hypothetical protein